MSRRTFVLAGTRILGVVSGYWLIEFGVALYRTFRTLLSLYPDHHITYFPTIETVLALVLAIVGIGIGLRSTKIAEKFASAPAPPLRLPILIGLAAAAYLTGFACRTAIQVGAIESVESYPEFTFYGGSQRARLGFDTHTTQVGRMIEPVVALGCVVVVGFGLIPRKRQPNV
jgi:hypothetical protein